LAFPYKIHYMDEGWVTGGTVTPTGLDYWEQCESPKL